MEELLHDKGWVLWEDINSTHCTSIMRAEQGPQKYEAHADSEGRNGVNPTMEDRFQDTLSLVES